MNKLSKAEEWLKLSKERKCTDFIAISINQSDTCISSVSCDLKKLIIMLLNVCEDNCIRETIISIAQHYSQEGGEQ